MPLLRCANTGAECQVNETPFKAGGSESDLAYEGQHPLTSAFTLDRCASGYSIKPHTEVSLNGRPITELAKLNYGDRISIGEILLFFEKQGLRELKTEIQGKNNVRVRATDIQLPEGLSIILGRESSSQVKCLNHLQVSLRHAELIRNGTKLQVRDLGSSNGTFINHRKVGKSWQTLQQNQRLSVGPFDFEVQHDRLIATSFDFVSADEPTSQASLTCQNLTCAVASQKTLLKDIDLNITPGKFVCLLGASGAGKSTLLKCLSNRICRRRFKVSGNVMLNKISVANEFDRIKSRIAYVPQLEILHSPLPLVAHLKYTAQLRLPADATKAEIDERITDILNTVKLSECRDLRICQLSGGQRKRAALANELLSNPDILFLDEVTSGLDELTDWEMMSLFREIADRGKTVVCISHTLANVDEFCHEVVCLAKFGRLAFQGTPQEAMKYFNVDSLSKVYGSLNVDAREQANELAEQFSNSRADGLTQSANLDDYSTFESFSFKKFYAQFFYNV